MKSAAIVTMHFPCNYGAVLQAYGLSHYLQKNGVRACIINYIPKYFEEKNSLWYVSPKYRNNILIRLLYYMAIVPRRVIQNRVFSKFRNTELTISRKLSYQELMCGSASGYDYYFCGSDQIWNENNDTINDSIYFLQFVKENNKRFAYAASGSISNPLSCHVSETVIPWLESFSEIAVREISLKNTLNSVLKRKVEHVCDPVFLLDRKEWIALSYKAKKHIKGNYILVYAIGDDIMPFKVAKEFGLSINMPVISISWTKNPFVDKYISCSPYDFLYLFSNASYVITNSFHGTAFSIIFNIEFWVCNTSIANHRLLSILEVAHLSNRLISKEGPIHRDNAIDWLDVNNRIAEHVSDSKTYLHNCLKG